MHLLDWQNLENIAYVIFCADIARLLQYFINLSDRFRNILANLQYFQGIFLQYCLNISVLCGTLYPLIPKYPFLLTTNKPATTP